MKRLFASVAPTPQERAAARAGDGLVARPDVVMDRAFTLDAPPAIVWPWLVQLGKRRAGWYLPARIEAGLPRPRRGLRQVAPRWQRLAVGDVIPDYGGRDATFTVARLVAPRELVYTSRRGAMHVSWSITLTPTQASTGTRVHLRLVLGPVRRRWLAGSVGELIDAATVAGLAAGLRERLDAH
jgi:hypothetical protein